MLFRRRWIAWTLAAALVAPVAAFAAPVDPTTAAKSFETVKGDEAVSLREQILKEAPAKSDITGRDRYVGDLGQAFIDQKLFTSTNIEGQLNAAITMAQLQTGSADKCLEEMLKSPNAAVRYWAAKGLIDAAGAIKTLGGSGKALSSLNDVLGSESSPIVKKQIVGAVVAFDDVDAMIGALQKIAAKLQTEFPDVDNLTFVQNTIGGTGPLTRYSLASLARRPKLTPKQKADAATAIAAIASYTIQQELAKPADDRPQNYHSSVTKVINECVTFANTLAGSKVSDPINGDPDLTSFSVSDVFGSPSSGPGKLQRAIADSKAPEAIKPATK